MKFIINGNIFFDADTTSLGLVGVNDEVVQISNPATRLLLLLIDHQGETVSREVIFRKVWGNYGMVSSNNNLNQCISKLRRVLKTPGAEDEVISTVPKSGFILLQHISVEDVSGENHPHRPPLSEAENEPDLTPSPSDVEAADQQSVAREMVVYFRRSGDDPQLSPWLRYRNHLHPAIHRTQDLLVNHPEQDWGLEEIAGHVHVSARHLSRLFRQHLGISVREYHEQLRLAIAQQRLQQGESAEKAALSAGFSSSRQLRRALQRLHSAHIMAGIQPS